MTAIEKFKLIVEVKQQTPEERAIADEIQHCSMFLSSALCATEDEHHEILDVMNQVTVKIVPRNSFKKASRLDFDNLLIEVCEADLYEILLQVRGRLADAFQHCLQLEVTK